MKHLPDRYRALTRLLRPGVAEREVSEELDQHVGRLVEDLRAQGMSETEATLEAKRRFGDRDRYEAEVRKLARTQQRWVRRRERVRTVLTDIRTTTRSLARHPGFSIAVLATLSLALGGTAATFTLVDEVLLRPLPYDAPEELVVLRHPVPGLEEGQEWGLSSAGYFYFAEQARSLAELGVWTGARVSLAGDEGAERALAVVATASLLRVLGATPALGRLFNDTDNLPDALGVAVLDHGLWIQRYGADPGIVGQSISVNSRPVEIVGVLPPEFAHPFLAAELWLPLELDRGAPAANHHYLASIGRLGPGTRLETAERELGSLTARLPDLFPTAYTPGFMDRYGFNIVARSLRTSVVGDSERVLWILFGVSLLVLVVATANAAGLFLVRTEARRRELAIRASLGASGGRLRWDAASEAFLLATGGAVAGLVLGTITLRVVASVGADSLPRATATSVSMGALAAVSLLAVAVGLTMAFLTRVLPSAPSTALRDGGQAGQSGSRTLLREAMMVGQITVALVLASGAGLLLRSGLNLGRVDTGLETEGVFLADLTLPTLRYGSFQDVRAFLEELALRLEADPTIRRVGFTNWPPLSGIDGCSLVFVENRPLASDERPPCVATPMASPGYFEALGVPIQGRAPSWSSVGEGEVVVSRSFANRFWPGEDPMGKGVRGNGGGPPFYRVVGVAGDVRADGLDKPPEDAVYFPVLPIEGAQLWSPPRSPTLAISTSFGDPSSVASLLRREVSALDLEVPLADVRSLGSVVAQTTAQVSFATALVSAGAVLALLLAAVGIYGLLAYLVGHRRAEIGVRMALGATTRDVLRMIVGRSLVVTGLGLALGLLGNLLLADVLGAMLFEVDPLDPATLAGAAGVLLAITLMASLIPARRAVAIDPVVALRAE